MKTAKIPVYIRFGEIPEDENSTVHRSDEEVRKEGGISVWEAIEVNGCYYPILPKHPNGNTLADYFHYLLDFTGNIYLVTGTKIFIEGADREPLLMNVIIIKNITHQYNHANLRKNIANEIINNERTEISEKEDKNEYSNQR